MREAIKRSGYLLEQRVEPVLTGAGFYVQMNEGYVDPETGKARGLDISAISAISVFKEEFIFPLILCECKNNSQPIVFFTKESPISFMYHEEVKTSGIPVKFLDKNRYISLSEFTKIGGFHHYCKAKVATQYCSFQLKKDKSSWMALHVEDQHEMFNSLIQALEYDISEHFGNFTLPPKGQEEGINIQIYYPLVILQGDLYSASLKNSHLSINKSDHIQFRKEIFYPSLSEWKKYQIDVITEKYLVDYLKLVDAEIKKIRKTLRNKRKQVRPSIKEMIAEARKAKKKPDSYRRFFDF
jgi:hypothetical protein